MKKGNMPATRSHISVSSAINTDVRDQGSTINCSGVRSGDGWGLTTLNIGRANEFYPKSLKCLLLYDNIELTTCKRYTHFLKNTSSKM